MVGAHLAQIPTAAPEGDLTVMARRSRTLPLRTAAAYAALGTGASRVTGLLRFVALAWALGQTPLADSYNLANTTPNMLYDIVLGGVLSATFIPVFVDHITNRGEDDAFESISAVCTVSVVVLLSTTLLALLLAPEIIVVFHGPGRAQPPRPARPPRAGTGRRHHVPALVRDPHQLALFALGAASSTPGGGSWRWRGHRS